MSALRQVSIKQFTDLDGDKGWNKFQDPCVVVLNRRALWNYCERLVAMFNHAVRQAIGNRNEGGDWQPVKLSPFIESDGNQGFGVMASIDTDSVANASYFEGSACVFGTVNITIKLVPPIGYMTEDVQARGIKAIYLYPGSLRKSSGLTSIFLTGVGSTTN